MANPSELTTAHWTHTHGSPRSLPRTAKPKLAPSRPCHHCSSRSSFRLGSPAIFHLMPATLLLFAHISWPQLDCFSWSPPKTGCPALGNRQANVQSAAGRRGRFDCRVPVLTSWLKLSVAINSCASPSSNNLYLYLFLYRHRIDCVRLFL